MSKQYAWSMNPQKLARAIGKKGSNATEAEIKEEYIRIGGKVALSELKEIKMDEEKELVPETPSVDVEETEVEVSASEPVAEVEEVSATPEVDVAPEETKTSTEDVG